MVEATTRDDEDDVEDEGGQQQGLETCRAPGNVSLVILFYFVLY